MEIDYFQHLEHHISERPDAVVLQSIRDKSREQLSWHEFRTQAASFSLFLQNNGIRPGDRVAMLMENDHHWVIALFASMGLGAVAVPLDPAQNPQKLADTIAHAECALLIVSTAFRATTEIIVQANPGLRTLEKSAPGETPQSDLSWSDALATPAPATWPLHHHAPDADCLLVYTGGTTGTPKGVRLSLRALLVTIQDTTAVFPLTPTDHVLSILPLFHIMAIQASVLGPLYRGSRITYLISRDPQRIVASFGEERATAFLCVPLFYYQLRRRIFEEVEKQPAARQFVFFRLLALSRFLRKNFGWNAGRIFFKPIHAKFGPTLRGFGVGGARFAPEVAESLHDLGFPFFQGYGMTETAALTALTPMSIDGGLSCGPPFGRATMRIVDPDENGIGEVTVTGPHLMSGYWKSPEATAQVIKDGWLHTGDLGYLAPDGRLHITGRKKDVIVLSSGKNIFPEPLEQHYQSASPLIAEMAICSLSGANGVSEQLHAVIVPEFTELQKRGIVNIREAILYDLQSAGKTLQAHERLHGFDIRKDPLPRTTARKLQRFRILEELRDRETQTETVAVAEPEQTAPDHQVIDIIRRMKGVHRVAPSMDLELDLSFDSLERVELLANVQDRFQVRFSESQTAKILTVADLIETVQAAASSDQAPAEWTSWRDILNEPLTPEEQALADTYLSPRPIAGPLLFVFTRIIALLARIFLRFRFDAKPWPETYPFVMAANHQSLLDTPLLMGRVPYRIFDRIFFLSTSRLHRGWFQTAFGRWARGIPIDPDRRLKSALRLAAEGLRRGLVLCVFPEGHRSLDESMQPFRKGLAILAVEQQVPVIPVGIRGTGKVWGRARKGFHLSPVSIETGNPILAVPSNEAGNASHDEFNARLFSAVEALVKKPT